MGIKYLQKVPLQALSTQPEALFFQQKSGTPILARGMEHEEYADFLRTTD